MKRQNRAGVEIDFCPSCRGVWLDRGELERLIEREGEYRSNYRDDDEYDRGFFGGDDDDRRDDRRGRRRGGFLDNVFDIFD